MERNVLLDVNFTCLQILRYLVAYIYNGLATLIAKTYWAGKNKAYIFFFQLELLGFLTVSVLGSCVGIAEENVFYRTMSGALNLAVN